MQLAYEELRDALEAIEGLDIKAKAPVKRYAGIRTSLIMTYYIAVSHEEETKPVSGSSFGAISIAIIRLT